MYRWPKMSRYETYRSNAVEAPIMRRWILAALVLSLAIHAAFLYYAYQKRLIGFHQPGVERLAPPRVFQMKRVSVPMEEPAPPVTKLQDKPKVPVPTVTIPIERPEVKEVVVAPQITDLSKALTGEKPHVDSAGLEALAKVEAGTRSEIDKELSAVNNALLKEGPRSPHQSVIELTGGSKIGSGSGDANVSIPGVKSLDEALAQTGPLHEGDKAGMPGGALFEYDSYDLRSDSIEQLRKLGMLFERYPNSTFSIEGHTDSFGPPDYNQKLSLARAESVKAWLVEVMGIEPDRIQTRGFGNTKWIVPPSKTKEEQAPNRRVEIVVRKYRK